MWQKKLRAKRDAARAEAKKNAPERPASAAAGGEKAAESGGGINGLAAAMAARRSALEGATKVGDGAGVKSPESDGWDDEEKVPPKAEAKEDSKPEAAVAAPGGPKEQTVAAGAQ